MNMGDDDLEARGKEIARRRFRHGIRTHSALAREVGMDRTTVGRAEAGEASEATVVALEAFLDRLDMEVGIDTSTPDSNEAHDLVEFDITGPRTEWHVTVKGPAEIADELRRQVVELLHDMEAGPKPDSD